MTIEATRSPRPDEVDSDAFYFPASVWTIMRVHLYLRVMGPAQTIIYRPRDPSMEPKPPILEIPPGKATTEMPYRIQQHVSAMDIWRHRVASTGAMDPVAHPRVEAVLRHFRPPGTPKDIQNPIPLVVVCPSQHVVPWLSSADTQGVILRPAGIQGEGPSRTMAISPGPLLLAWGGSVVVTDVLELKSLPAFPLGNSQERFAASVAARLNEAYALGARLSADYPCWVPMLLPSAQGPLGMY